MASIHPETQAQAHLTAYVDPPTPHDDTSLPCSAVNYGCAPQLLKKRHYCNEDLGLEDAPPPLPERNYSWSDLEDNDDEALGDNSEDDAPPTPLGDKQPQKKTGSISRSREGVEHKRSRRGVATGTSLERTSSTSKSKKEKRLGEKLKKRADREIERREKQEKKEKFKESEALRRGKSQKKERKRYFGSPLDTVATEEGVPLFVRKCVAIIEEDLCTEGLYRVSGGREDVIFLQELFDEDTNVDLKTLENKLIEFCYVITSAVKNFFRLLPDPLISNPVADELLKIRGMQPSLQAAATKECLSALPEVNKKTLYFMCRHLCQRDGPLGSEQAPVLATGHKPVLFNIIIICDMCQPCSYMADMKFLAKWTEGE
ncbi:hypothetical protein EMCRGX_G034260 [Ephydatia muelleri]